MGTAARRTRTLVHFACCILGTIDASRGHTRDAVIHQTFDCRRWLLSWLPESHEPSLEEWSASNLYLIPSKPQKQRDAAAAAQQQRYASKWPPPRPGRHMHGLPNGSPASPYGRFGKSFPPTLEAPLERREEEESEQVRKAPLFERVCGAMWQASRCLLAPRVLICCNCWLLWRGY